MFYIKCKSEVERTSVLSILLGHGWKNVIEKTVLSDYPFEKYSFIIMDKETKEFGLFEEVTSNHKKVTINQIISQDFRTPFKPIRYGYICNGRYDVTILKDNIKVGCSNVSFQELEKLYEAYSKFKKEWL